MVFTGQSLTAGATCVFIGSRNFKLRYELTIHLIPPLSVDFDHNVTQYQFNIIQSSLPLKKKREREKMRRFNARVTLALNSAGVTACSLCELGGICNEVYLHWKGAIFRRMYEYSLICTHANGTGADRGGSAVCGQFACISPFANALWTARYFFFLSFAQV